MSKGIKIPKCKLYYFFFFLVFIEPPIIDKMPSLSFLHTCFMLCRIAISSIILLAFIKRGLRNKVELRLIVLLFWFWGVQIIATAVSNGLITNAIMNSITVIAPCLWVLIKSEESDNIIESLKDYMYFLIIANVISIMLFPNGIYTSNSMWSEDSMHYYVLSIENSMAPYLLTTIMLSGISLLRKRRNIKFDVVAVIFCIITPFLLESATLLLVVSLFVVLGLAIIFTEKFDNKSFINLYIIIAIAMTFLIVLFRRMDIFAYLIEVVLKRDLTLTSRTRIWDASLDAICQKIILGYGVQNTVFLRNLLKASHQHNYYLHILFQGGIIAFASFCVIMNECRKHLNSNVDKNKSLMAVCLFCYMIAFIGEVYGDGIYILPFFLCITIIVSESLSVDSGGGK